MRTEKTLFSCPIGTKTVSICGEDSHAVYRFGKVPRAELEAHRLSFAEHGFSGGGETQIIVENNGYRYVLYDSTVRTGFGADGHNDPKFNTGLLIQKAGRTISNKSCAGSNGTGIDSAASKFMPAGTFVTR